MKKMRLTECFMGIGGGQWDSQIPGLSQAVSLSDVEADVLTWGGLSSPATSPPLSGELHATCLSSQCSFISPASFPVSNSSPQGNIIKRALVIWEKGIKQIVKVQ